MRALFVNPLAYPAFDPSIGAAIGGMETRGVLLAREVAAAEPGAQVSILVKDHGQPARQRFGRVEVLADIHDRVADQAVRVGLYRSSKGFPHWMTGRWYPEMLTAALTRTAGVVVRRAVVAVGGEKVMRGPPPLIKGSLLRRDFDVLCAFGGNDDSALVVRAGRARKTPSILFLASDSDLNADYFASSLSRNQAGHFASWCHYAVANADVLVAQTDRQRELARQRFGRDAFVLPNPIDIEEWDSGNVGTRSIDGLPPRYALWIGRSDTFHKRPELCVEIARRLPDIEFVLVMNRSDAAVHERVIAGAPANVRFVEYVPSPNMPAIFARAVLLVSTSSAAYEGFPNTFLQAAASRVPVASLEVDPGGLLAKSGGGSSFSGDVDALTANVAKLWYDEQLRDSMGAGARAYVVENHAASRIGSRAALILRTALDRAKDGSVGTRSKTVVQWKGNSATLCAESLASILVGRRHFPPKR